MGGYGGAAVAHAGFKALILHGWKKPVIFIFLSPVIGFIVAIAITTTPGSSAVSAPDKWIPQAATLLRRRLQPRPRHQ